MLVSAQTELKINKRSSLRNFMHPFNADENIQRGKYATETNLKWFKRYKSSSMTFAIYSSLRICPYL